MIGLMKFESTVAVAAVIVMLVMVLRLCDGGSCCCCCRCYPAGVNIAAVVAMNDVCDTAWHWECCGLFVAISAGVKVTVVEFVTGRGWCMGLLG